MILWFTGQPGCGKTTLAKEIISDLDRLLTFPKLIHIDGDDLRDVLDNKDYSERGRRKNIQFAINMAKVMENKGYLVLVSLVSPFRDLRIGEVFWLNSTRPTDKEKYWVDNYEPPMKDFTYINTDNSIKECIDEILDVYWQVSTLA